MSAGGLGEITGRLVQASSSSRLSRWDRSGSMGVVLDLQDRFVSAGPFQVNRT